MMFLYSALAAIPVVYIALTFNRLVRSRNLLREAWSGVDVQLKRRRDLIPAMVENVKSYADLEVDMLERIATAREQCVKIIGVYSKGQAEKAFSREIKRLLKTCSPKLEARAGFIELQQTLTAVEDDIQFARRYYNGTVRNYNCRVESFPSLLVAKLLRFKKAEFFEIQYATERTSPDVEF